MKALNSLLAIFVFCIPVTADEPDGEWPIRGRVVDEQGAVIEKFVAASMWSANGIYWDHTGKTFEVDGTKEISKVWKEEGVLAANPRYQAQYLPGGRFTFKVEGGSQRAVFVTDSECRRGGCALIAKVDCEQELCVKLVPMTRVHGQVYCQEAKRKPDWIYAGVELPSDQSSGAKFMFCGSLKSEFSFFLPPGKYNLVAYSESPDASMAHPADAPADMPRNFHGIQIAVPADQAELDLGVLNVDFGKGKGGKPRGDYSALYGKQPPPLSITDACGVGKNVSLADYRGRWVLLEFWTLWCGSCTEVSLPKLTKFYEEHASDRDRFEILAICVTDAERLRTKEDFAPHLTKLADKAWNGRTLPFPVLIDGDGETVSSYGTQGYPAVLLIDPDGNLVKWGDAELLAEKLKEK